MCCLFHDKAVFNEKGLVVWLIQKEMRTCFYKLETYNFNPWFCLVVTANIPIEKLIIFLSAFSTQIEPCIV